MKHSSNRRSLQLAHEQVGEVHGTFRTQRERAALRQAVAGKFDQGVTVNRDLHAAANHPNLQAMPATRLIGDGVRCTGGVAYRSGHPAGRRKCHLQVLAAAQEKRTGFALRVWEATIDNELRVSIRLRGRQCLSIAVVAQHRIARVPVFLSFVVGFPARQVQSGVHGSVPLRYVANLFLLRIGAGQFLDLEVLEAALGAFGLEGEVALARGALANAGKDLAVHRQLDDAVVRLNAVVVPLVGAPGAILRWYAALPTERVRPIGNALRAPDAEEVAVARCRDAARLLVLPFEVDEDLHLDSARVTAADGGDPVGPDEEAAVADVGSLGRH